MIEKVAREQRRGKRTRVSLPVRYSDGPEVGVSLPGGAMTTDISISGIGLFSEGNLRPGTVLEIECEDLWDSPKKFVVRWSNRIGYNFFRVGLTAGK
jgi:hypothetical protein